MNRRCSIEKSQQGETETVSLFTFSGFVLKSGEQHQLYQNTKSRSLRPLNGSRKLKTWLISDPFQLVANPRARSQAGIQVHSLRPRLLFAWCDVDIPGVSLALHLPVPHWSRMSRCLLPSPTTQVWILPPGDSLSPAFSAGCRNTLFRVSTASIMGLTHQTLQTSCDL